MSDKVTAMINHRVLDGQRSRRENGRRQSV